MINRRVRSQWSHKSIIFLEQRSCAIRTTFYVDCQNGKECSTAMMLERMPLFWNEDLSFEHWQEVSSKMWKVQNEGGHFFHEAISKTNGTMLHHRKCYHSTDGWPWVGVIPPKHVNAISREGWMNKRARVKVIVREHLFLVRVCTVGNESYELRMAR